MEARMVGGPPWGFSLVGGVDFRSPLRIGKVSANGKAQRSGVLAGNLLLKVNGVECAGLRHMEAQRLVKNARDVLELQLGIVEMRTKNVQPQLEPRRLSSSLPRGMTSLSSLGSHRSSLHEASEGYTGHWRSPRTSSSSIGEVSLIPCKPAPPPSNRSSVSSLSGLPRETQSTTMAAADSAILDAVFTAPQIDTTDSSKEIQCDSSITVDATTSVPTSSHDPPIQPAISGPLLSSATVKKPPMVVTKPAQKPLHQVTKPVTHEVTQEVTKPVVQPVTQEVTKPVVQESKGSVKPKPKEPAFIPTAPRSEGGSNWYKSMFHSMLTNDDDATIPENPSSPPSQRRDRSEPTNKAVTLPRLSGSDISVPKVSSGPVEEPPSPKPVKKTFESQDSEEFMTSAQVRAANRKLFGSITTGWRNREQQQAPTSKPQAVNKPSPVYKSPPVNKQPPVTKPRPVYKPSPARNLPHTAVNQVSDPLEIRLDKMHPILSDALAEDVTPVNVEPVATVPPIAATSVAMETSGTSITIETPDTFVTMESLPDKSVTMETPGTSVTTMETPGTSVTMETPGTSVTMETPGTSVTMETPGTSVTMETPGTSVTMGTSDASVTVETTETVVATEPSAQSDFTEVNFKKMHPVLSDAVTDEAVTRALSPLEKTTSEDVMSALEELTAVIDNTAHTNGTYDYTSRVSVTSGNHENTILVDDGDSGTVHVSTNDGDHDRVEHLKISDGNHGNGTLADGSHGNSIIVSISDDNHGDAILSNHGNAAHTSLATDTLSGASGSGNRSNSSSRSNSVASKSRPPPAPTGRALYGFSAQNIKEMSFKKGTIIQLTRTVDQNWLEGEVDGLKGIFPSSYVELIFKSGTQSPGSSVAPQSHDPSPSPTPGDQPCAVARHNFQAESSKELSFKKGETLYLVKRVDDNWFKGRSAAGQVGIFPCSYVKVTVDLPETVEYVKGNTPPVHAELLDEVDQKPKKKTPPPRPSQNPAVSMVKGKGHSPMHNPHSSAASSFAVPGDCYECLFAYEPCNTDELGLQVGDKVIVFEQCDDGWFMGMCERSGDFGAFPGNYVRKMD